MVCLREPVGSFTPPRELQGRALAGQSAPKPEMKHAKYKTEQERMLVSITESMS
ncbi:hypothetical protein I2I11_01860 [Pontibacter sp. 172403-2]|uniref:hypothetical protein n=1 Tax=Pontibacter rufus TaxID=2791028 RepID=UPI0018AF94BB|nr:hypothetical protein [Pontibacter sp. 172403-2]MBF9252030.1 hypothetical protein [Pontibacter sp. 172403-2]